jgi:hypothetical protein
MGKMTPALQLTDTDASFLVQAFAREAKQAQMIETKRAAEACNVTPQYVCGAEQILEIADHAHSRLVESQLKREFIVAGAFRNAMLAFRPSLSQGKLVSTADQEWCKDLQMGSHRLKWSWLKDRRGWLDEDGKPMEPDYKRSAAKRMEEMEEPTPDPETDDYTLKLGGKVLQQAVVSLSGASGWDTQMLVPADETLALKHPKERRRLLALSRVGRDQLRRRITGKRKYWKLAAEKAEELRDAKHYLELSWQDYVKEELKLSDAMTLLSKLRPV